MHVDPGLWRSSCSQSQPYQMKPVKGSSVHLCHATLLKTPAEEKTCSGTNFLQVPPSHNETTYWNGFNEHRTVLGPADELEGVFCAFNAHFHFLHYNKIFTDCAISFLLQQSTLPPAIHSHKGSDTRAKPNAKHMFLSFSERE